MRASLARQVSNFHEFGTCNCAFIATVPGSIHSHAATIRHLELKNMRLIGKALTFDDVLLVPAFSQVLPEGHFACNSFFTRNIALNLPLVSAAMDTVTEARLAIAIAQEGGIGIVHKNMTAKEQAAQVSKVKRYESGVLRDPVVITPQHTVRQVAELSEPTRCFWVPGLRWWQGGRHCHGA
jgi:hypothetical protein